MKAMLILFSTILSTTGLFANLNPGLITSDAKSLIINARDWKSSSINISIRDVKNTSVFEETLNGKEIKKYNLKNFPAGTYALEITDDQKTTTQEFVLTSKEISFTSNVRTIFRPYMKYTENGLDFNLLTLNQSALISIYNENDELVFQSNLPKGAISKRFSMKELPSGQYYVNVNIAEKTFSDSFRK